MNTCKKCGAVLEDQDKFCGECGSNIECDYTDKRADYATNCNNTEDCECGCDEEYQNDQHKTSSSQYNSKSHEEIKMIFLEILQYSRHMITKPMTTISNEAQSLSKNLSLYLMGILSILSGIITILSIKSISNGMTRMIGLVESLLPYNLNLFSEFFHIGGLPYGRIFFFSAIFFLTGVAVIFLSCHFILKYILKSQVEIIDSIKIAVSSLIPYIVGRFLSFLVNYLSPTLGFIVIFVAIIICILSFFKGIISILRIEEDKAIFILPTCYLIMFLCQYSVLKLFIKNLFR